MPLTNTVEVARAVPEVETEYHFIPVPVATRLATVGKDPEQNDWDVEPAGATGGAGCVLTTILADADEIHPDALVTVYV